MPGFPRIAERVARGGRRHRARVPTSVADEELQSLVAAGAAPDTFMTYQMQGQIGGVTAGAGVVVEVRIHPAATILTKCATTGGLSARPLAVSLYPQFMSTICRSASLLASLSKPRLVSVSG
jgi:hypothetical protein